MAEKIAMTGGINDVLSLLQSFSGTGGTTKSRTGTTGSQINTGTSSQQVLGSTNQNQTQNITGTTSQTGTQQGSTSQTGSTAQTGSNTSTQTTRSDITAEGINKMLQDILSGDQGIAQIAMGERSAGAYNSTSRQFLTNDLLSRTAGELAKLQAGTTTSTVGSTNQMSNTSQVGSSSQVNNQTGTSNQNAVVNTSGTTNQNTTGQTSNTQTSTQDQQNETVVSKDAALDPVKILGLIAGGQIGSSAIGALLPALGMNDGLGGLLKQIGASGGAALGNILKEYLPGNEAGYDINNIFNDLTEDDMNWLDEALGGGFE